VGKLSLEPYPWQPMRRCPDLGDADGPMGQDPDDGARWRNLLVDRIAPPARPGGDDSDGDVPRIADTKSKQRQHTAGYKGETKLGVVE
jgi:hypothetical protein